MRRVYRFLTGKETIGGVLLIVATLLAMLVANSPLRTWYDALLSLPIEVRVGTLEVAKPMLLWVNDGLMALFFLLVGLEVKREVIIGHLSSRQQMILPGLAAVGGMLVPALIYVAINRNDPQALHGWAIPAATDIAFALGVLALLGERVPVSLKVFLMALAIMDDLGAIVIIALFYSGDLSGVMLLLAFVSILVLFTFNRCRITGIAPYVTVGALLWLFVLKSGVHATLAGVVIAFTIPLHGREGEPSPLETLEHDLQPWVNFMILPVFAFANAGLSLAGVGLADFFEPVSLGIVLGLVVGKLVGVFGFSWLSIKLGLTALPKGATFSQLLGVSALCGIGFTMSLFIGGLAFQHTGADYFVAHRIGILTGSLVAALLGLALLHATTEGTSS